MTGTLGVVAPQGLLGEIVLEQLANASVSASAIRVLDGAPDAAARVAFGTTRLPIHDLRGFDFGHLDTLIVAGPASDYREVIDKALAAGCRVAATAPDGGGREADEQSLLTIVPETAVLAAHALVDAASAVAAPVCVDAVSLEPAAAAGQDAVQGLARESAEVLNARTPEPSHGGAIRAFNAILAGRAEHAAQDVPIRVTRVQVPVFFGYGVVCHVGFNDEVDPATLRDCLGGAPAMTVVEAASDSGVRDLIDSDGVGVVLLTQELACVHQCWLVGDNLRLQAKGLTAGVMGNPGQM